MSKKNASGFLKYLVFAAFLLIGAFCGVLMAAHLSERSEDAPFWQILGELVLLFVGMYAAIFVQTLIHEAGHLLAGLATGYRFSSFRVGSWMILKDKDGHFQSKKISIAGTGGQCLMAPPDCKWEKLPYVLYNLGGSLLNLAASLVFYLLSILLSAYAVPRMILLMLTVIGVAFALLNGIPMRLGTVDNDGYNALSLGKTKSALRSFYIQTAVSAQMTQGVALADMPPEWFTPPTDEDMKNSMAAVMGVFSSNRLMVEHRFEEARLLMEHYLNIDTAIVGLHRNLLVCDLAFCELMRKEDRSHEVSMLLNRDMRKFMRSMANFPTVIRTEYAAALLLDDDEAKAEAAQSKFDQIAKTYPYPTDIDSERDLMRIAKEKYDRDKSDISE